MINSDKGTKRCKINKDFMLILRRCGKKIYTFLRLPYLYYIAHQIIQTRKRRNTETLVLLLLFFKKGSAGIWLTFSTKSVAYFF